MERAVIIPLSLNLVVYPVVLVLLLTAASETMYRVGALLGQ